jgi:hypothetical protein
MEKERAGAIISGCIVKMGRKPEKGKANKHIRVTK